MSVSYKAINWNRNKRIYDATIAAGVAAYLFLFVAIGWLIRPPAERLSPEVLLIRAFGTCAFLMLHLVLCIGPLARLEPRLLTLVYNRRHLGVATCVMAAAHAGLAIGYYHGFGRWNPFVSLLASNSNYLSFTAFPFELLGIAAFVILLTMATTSHDFWQRNLGPSLWKGLHMLVYPAYGLVAGHVALGGLQSEHSPIYAVLAATGLAIVVGVHVAVGLRERLRDRGDHHEAESSSSPWVDVGSIDDIADCRAAVVCLPGRERIAVFRYGGLVSAVTNVCAHQRGPLGEGKVVDGCITCPWHGWEYLPASGQSPPPFAERISTFRVRVEKRRIWLNPEPLPPGAFSEPARIDEGDE